MERLRLGLVMDSPIAVMVIVGTLLAVAIFKGTSWLIIAILVMFVALILLFGIIYVVWSIKDPDKLRPSEHEIRKFEILHGAGDNTRQIATEDINQAKAVPNPAIKELEAGKGKK